MLEKQQLAEGIKESAMSHRKRNKSQEPGFKEEQYDDRESIDSMDVYVEELSDLEQRVEEFEEGTA